ncbi:unnamed protein product [Cyberlindnera jadinii]|uniref:MFS general substrate transporter n=1 Tax=Cyberlindnera jadinii (strain ATCC 18201 / CBS 1600 / BCRC 20928 / JCM 3617 / NBRC 0987 / NRRL Y-1542) TaxID=983966 RepID=A0A0H5C8X5_CYBJN|nr:MFS general substrate transporter [Cyberlindnera jadinii NRRL Y-1542]ODV70697.1 MFS general substrate transporter [Cyberlindnera jadinii NRRL Y-1542]CEP24815.1 unnamed protein product [Cyberlindnera jadinii]
MNKEVVSTECIPVISTQPSNKDDYDGNYHPDDYIDAAPDGGYGWWCCAGVAMMNFATWGANSSFGVMLSFYLQDDEFPGGDATLYALMMGLLMFFTLATISFASIGLYKFGYRPTVWVGIIVQLGAYLGASFARTMVQLIMTQGVLLGLAIGIIFGANSIVLPSWFLRRRAIALGISQAGIGIGGIVFSLSTNAIIHKTGDHKWALRFLGIVSFAICASTSFIIKPRIPKNDKHLNEAEQQSSLLKVIKSVLDYKMLKSFPLQLITVWVAFTNASYIVCLFSLSNYAVSIGLNETQATTITVLFNLSQAVGRPLTGYLCEVFGRVNFSLMGTLYICILTLCWWINVHSYASLICFALAMGLFVGVSSVSWSPLVVDVVGMNSFASASSWVCFWMASGSLIAEVVAVNLRDYSLQSHSPYFYCQLFVGSMYCFSTMVLIPYREWRIRRMLNQWKKQSMESDREYQYEELLTDNSPRSYIKRALLNVKI